MYKVLLPDGCYFWICQGCVTAGEERGGGTVLCCACGNVVPAHRSVRPDSGFFECRDCAVTC